MASKIIYPPIIPNYLPAFETNSGVGRCIIPFSLSKFNINEDFDSLHVSIMKQGNGKSVVSNVDEQDGRLRNNNEKIILNVEKNPDEEQPNSYYCILTERDIYGNKQEIGSVYKVQIRLSQVRCNDPSNQSDWLKNNASSFSEWSTVCVIKAIGLTNLVIGEPFNFDSLKEIQTGGTANVEGTNVYSQDSIQFGGRVINEDPSEKLYSYNLKLYRIVDNLEYIIEDSGLLFSNKYQDSNEFNYFFKEEFQNNYRYKIVFTYTTINEYTGVQEEIFDIDYSRTSAPDMYLVTVESIDIPPDGCFHDTDNENNKYHKNLAKQDSPGQGIDYPNNEDISIKGSSLTSISQEEDEGRIGLKLMYIVDPVQTGNFCIRRSDEKSNFTKQEDIKIIVLKQESVADLDIVYDYTIESGVYYKYGVQQIDQTGNRSLMQEISNPIVRHFSYSFLLGENGKQLKLKFDNTMQSFKVQQMESKMDLIGNRYPVVTRNAAVEYKTFPITGLISFQMDDNKLFCTMDDFYGRNAHNHKHFLKDDNDLEYTEIYDYTQEKDFRKTVLNFLQNGKPKLFKSPTEGNVVVRLMDVNCTPNQTLDRMVYSFTSNAFELDDATMENYRKYNFYEVGEQAKSFEKEGTAIGQLSITFKETDNIIKLIYDKYNSRLENQKTGDLVKKVQKVYRIQITVNDPPLRAHTANNKAVLGNNVKIIGSSSQINTQIITFFNGIYLIDENIKFTKDSQLYLLGEDAGEGGKKAITEVNANIDFIYDYISEEYQGKKKISMKSRKGIGQIINVQKPGVQDSGNLSAGESITALIKEKYRVDTIDKYAYLNELPSVEIEADPGTVFLIVDDSTNVKGDYHEINETGILRFFELSNIKSINYMGKRQGDTILTVPGSASVTYYYTLLEGEYAKEV